MQLPKLSTEFNFLTITFLLAILVDPIVNANVKESGNPSGIAETARATTAKNISIKWYCLQINTQPIKIEIPIIIKVICLENFSILIVNGDLLSSVDVTFSAIFPTSVSIPVAVTTAIALPVKTEVPAYNIHFLESSPRDEESLLLATPILSPVRTDSSTVRLFELIILASLDTLVPGSTIIISPGTKYEESIS